MTMDELFAGMEASAAALGRNIVRDALVRIREAVAAVPAGEKIHVPVLGTFSVRRPGKDQTVPTVVFHPLQKKPAEAAASDAGSSPN